MPERDYLYVIAHDTFSRRVYDSGIRVIPDDVTIRNLLVTLHRGTTAIMYHTSEFLPEGVEEA